VRPPTQAFIVGRFCLLFALWCGSAERRKRERSGSFVSAGGAGGLLRLRWPSRLREVGKTVGSPLAGSLGPSFSRVSCPDGGDEAGAAASFWNKSLLSLPRCGGADPGASARYVRVCFSRSSALGLGRECTGASRCLPVLLPPVAAAEATLFSEGEGPAAGSVASRSWGLGFFFIGLRWRTLVPDLERARCVLSLWYTGDAFLFSGTDLLCGSCRSQGEMVLLQILVCGSSVCSAVGVRFGDAAWWCSSVAASSVVPLGLFVIFCFVGVFCEVWWGQLRPRNPSSGYLYLVVFVYVSLIS